jgi:hypothetical protein
MDRGDLWLVRGLAKIVEWLAWLCTLPLVLLLGLLVGEVFFWLFEAHWVRLTICTLYGYLNAPADKQVNQFLAHELDRCDVNTGARGVDLIVNYVLNEMPAFLSVSALSIFGLFLFIFMHQTLTDSIEKIEREAEAQR